jgi:phosphohistidine phosphatase
MTTVQDGPVSSPHTLVVVRHAKAEPYADTDYDRRLTRRGHTEAASAAEFLASTGLRPDTALVSAAVRAVETWGHLREATGSAEADPSEEFYSASADEVLDAVRKLPETAASAVYVGHNPAAGSFAYSLNDGEGDPAVVRGLLEGFPTAAVAVFRLPGSWADLEEGTARLLHFHAPGR